MLKYPLEELLIIAKYMRVQNAENMTKEDIIYHILLMEKYRTPYCNDGKYRFSLTPDTTDVLKEKINSALLEIKDALNKAFGIK